ncbi:diguanylate cyclase domain-containing protein [Rhizobium skierniewicense]|uniref:diguanylate cyclase domain-containing protein n=1 Tax=Rhizobium skierniewicense TaxID=984260 RepID=UPI001572B96F|nr:diguanylate cyclase [Rhizobium skierniewicense]NTF32686.1 diguanylate cyclase [Rhizobium skierniewicense]
MIQGTVVHQTKPIEFGNEADAIRVCITDKQGQVQMASPDFFEGLSVATAPVSNHRLEIKCGDNGTILAFEDIVNAIACQNRWAGWCRVVADELLALLRRPITISGLDIVIGASIGIAVNVSKDDELDVLLRRADIALYTVKHNGKNGFHVFDAD